MALETLKNVTEINNYKVHRVEWEQPEEHHIEINDRCNAITFKIQDGPIKENGHNGCQVDEIIQTAKIIISKLNMKFPCEGNFEAIKHLGIALDYLKLRKRNREARGVEGTNQK